MTRKRSEIRVVLKGYGVDPNDGIAVRMAKLLNYLAIHMPSIFIPFPWIAKIIFMRPKMPVEAAPDVKKVRSNQSSARQKLMVMYGRGLVSKAGFGARATTDQDDAVQTSAELSARRSVFAANRFDETMDMIKPASIRKAKVRERFNELSAGRKVLMSDKVMGRLRSPDEGAADS